MLKITLDENIAFASEAFREFGNVELLHGRKITNKNLQDTDILIVRSITRVDEELLGYTPVKFVGTATIGTDHIDIEYLKENNIAFADAKGCNADAVAEYVFTALAEIINMRNKRFNELTLGVVGVGNIGSRIVRLASVLGMRVLQNDPPLKRMTGRPEFTELPDLSEQSDIITFHVPLNLSGEDRTHHLMDDEKLSGLRDNMILINSSRGSVIDNEELKRVITEKSFQAVLDVWENEPGINTALLEKVLFATPHIAGYSYEGKVNGTVMMYNALCRYLNSSPVWKPDMLKVENNIIDIREDTPEKMFREITRRIYKIENDDRDMKSMLSLKKSERGEYFDSLRKNYSLRREFSNYIINLEKEDESFKEILGNFRFQVV